VSPNLGHLALLVAAGGLLSGAFLAFHYAPTFEAARDATAHVETLPLGTFLRSLHHWCGTFTLVLAGLHALRLFWHGEYKAPWRGLWVLGALMALVLLGFAYTGYLLAGDERALAGIRVMEGVASSTPLAGDALASAVRGGDAISSATLTRLYAMHAIVLPAALVFLVAAFVARVRRLHGDLAPTRDAKAALAVLALLAVCAALFPPGLGPKADLAGEGAADARPEWFFLWVNELLHRVPGNTFLVAGLLPAALVALAIGLPFLARGAERRAGARKAEIAAAAAILLAIGGLTAASFARTPENAPEPPPAPADTLTPLAVMEKFQCARCHRIEGAESVEDTGPPINRLQSPAVKELFTREFFRRKVGDPRKYWDGTSMTYTPTRLKPTTQELAALERWFYGD
jgi:quinol-cytochrome oxidoreductase complex cytochrome b subunit